jgi:hypothetical protein
MLGERFIHISTELTLLIVVGILLTSILLSLAIPEKEGRG